VSDTPTPPSGRPRPWLLAALGITLVFAAWMWMRPVNPAGPAGGPSNARRAAQQENGSAVDPAALDVRLEALESRQVSDQTSARNPFRFQPKPPPPPPPMPKVDTRPVPPDPLNDKPVGPPPPPPIPLKFIGVVEPKAGDKVAAFSDCRTTTYARPGGVIFGQYRLVSIGVESVVMEYLDGRGRTTIRQQGQECVGK
jgi:hypothetical protein